MLYYTKFTMRNLMKFEKNICTEYEGIELVCMFNYEYYYYFFTISSIWFSLSFPCLFINAMCIAQCTLHMPYSSVAIFWRFESLIFLKQIAAYYSSTFSQEKVSLFFHHHKLMSRKNGPNTALRTPSAILLFFWSIHFGNIKRKSEVCVCGPAFSIKNLYPVIYCPNKYFGCYSVEIQRLNFKINLWNILPFRKFAINSLSIWAKMI